MELCGKGCHAVCDFCSHYADDSKTNPLPKDDPLAELSAGYGMCLIYNIRVNAGMGQDCPGFHCFRLLLKEVKSSTTPRLKPGACGSESSAGPG